MIREFYKNKGQVYMPNQLQFAIYKIIKTHVIHMVR